MLCTVVWEEYRNDEREEMWQALRTLIPLASPNWSLKGIYAYWDPETHALLYVGLATNLPMRFAQHNGLVSHSGGNKAEKIDEWFANHDALGFTVLLQGAAVQSLDDLHQIDPLQGVDVDDIAKIAEGQLIELYRQEHGRWPAWNGVGGSLQGAGWARPQERSVIGLLSASDESLFVARRTLRALVADPIALRFEVLIHGARMRVLLDLHAPTAVEGGAAETDSTALMESITRFLMLADGKLIDDLSPVDEAIRAWVSRFSDVVAMQAARDQAIADVRGLRSAAKLERELVANSFIQDLVSLDADEEVAADAAEIAASRYLEEPAPLRGSER